MKPDLLQELNEIGGLLYYQGRIAQENQLKTQDLDRCKFVGFIEMGHNEIKGTKKYLSCILRHSMLQIYYNK